MIDDILSQLQSSKTAEEREWIIMQFSLQNLPSTVQTAIWVAAVPHWFDKDFLKAILGNEADLTEDDFQLLLKQSYVELFPEFDYSIDYSIHKRTRTLLLNKLWQDDKTRYRTLSCRAANYCLQQDASNTTWRIETLYHQLLADMKGIVDEFNDQCADWWNNFQYDTVEALIQTVLEVARTKWITAEADRSVHHWKARLESHFELEKVGNEGKRTKKTKVYINASSEDRDSAHEIMKFMGERDVDCIPPIDFTKSSIEIGRSLEVKLRETDVIVVLSGNDVPNEWVSSQFSRCQRVVTRLNRSVEWVLYGSKESLKEFFLYQSPYLSENINVASTIGELLETLMQLKIKIEALSCG